MHTSAQLKGATPNISEHCFYKLGGRLPVNVPVL